MIRVALVDDHYAIRLGLTAALDAEPDLQVVGAAACATEVPAMLRRVEPDVFIVDYRLPDGDGLSLCRRVKGHPPCPAVVLHSAFADDWLLVPAVLAGADAIVPKGTAGGELTEAVRAVAAGRCALPPVDPEVLRAAGEALDPEDLPVLGMLMHGTSARDVASTLRLAPAVLRARQDRMLAALRPTG